MLEQIFIFGIAVIVRRVDPLIKIGGKELDELNANREGESFIVCIVVPFVLGLHKTVCGTYEVLVKVC